MNIMQLIDLMNYNFESNKESRLYEIYYKFIESNQEILTPKQLDYASTNILPPLSFDDGKNRSQEEYDQIQETITKIKNNKISYETGRGMAA